MKARFKDFFTRNHIVFYGIICLVANVLAVLSTTLTNFPLPDMESLAVWQAFLARHRVLVNSLSLGCYLVPVVLCVLYTAKVPRGNKSDKAFIELMVHIPGAYALRGIMGWVCNFVLEVIFLIALKLTTGTDINFILISSTITYVFLSVFTFTLIYFTLETLNRNVVLPALYPDGNISDVSRMSISSIKNTFLFYFFSAAVFPTAFVGIRLFFTKRYDMEIPNYYDFAFTSILLLLGLVLTVLLIGYFKNPLEKLNRAARQIGAGNYDTKTVICSNDEMGVLGDSFNAMARSLKEKEFMRDTFGKIVAPQVRDYLLGGNVALGGETLDVTVMFCDIRGFTTLSENMMPEKVVSLLNRYFTALSACISAHNGVINKYIGDAVMALFGAPVRSDRHALDALSAALDMRGALIELNRDFAADGLPHIRFGIGLHSGSVLAGNIGAADRMEYTVIGDTVNTASRIEGLCKAYKTDLLVSENTARLIGGDTLTFVAESDIRGRAEKVRLYTA